MDSMFSNPWLYSSGGETSLLHRLNTGLRVDPVNTYALSASLYIRYSRADEKEMR